MKPLTQWWQGVALPAEIRALHLKQLLAKRKPTIIHVHASNKCGATVSKKAE